jgi:hypothetical protein
VIAGTEDIIGLGDIRPLTDAKSGGQCKTVSANRIGATELFVELRAILDSLTVIPDRFMPGSEFESYEGGSC